MSLFPLGLEIHNRSISAALQGLRVSTLAITLMAGLWPFHIPDNNVSWTNLARGLVFGKHATVRTCTSFHLSMPGRDEFSLELWVIPRQAASSTLLVFSTPDNLSRFGIRQSVTDLVLVQGHTQLFVDNVLRPGRSTFITISDRAHQVVIYVNGNPVRSFVGFPVNGGDLMGTLSLGVSSTADDSWSGRLLGLALYGTALNDSRVGEHFESWVNNGRPSVSEADRAAAIYTFDEGAGTIAHNLIAGQPDLQIPAKFTLLHQVFLTPVWKEFHPDLSYLEDLVINIAGFIPLGFFFYPRRHFRYGKFPELFTVLFGFGVSLAIEIIQSFLPTRQSGTTDLITNTLGTAIGVWLFRSRFWRRS
jgi:VanZ family protein